MDTKIGPFGSHFETHFKAIRNLGSLAPPWTSLAPSWGHFGVILGVNICEFGCSFAKKYVFFRVSVGSSNDSYLCWNTPIMFPDVFQDTLFYEYYLQNHWVEYCTDTATCFRNTLVRLQHYSQDISCRH